MASLQTSSSSYLIIGLTLNAHEEVPLLSPCPPAAQKKENVRQLKGVTKKNVTHSQFKIVISQEWNVLGGCPSHSL